MPMLKAFPLYFVNCIPPASSETKGNSDRVNSDRAACPSAGAVLTSASPLLRKSASVGFTWFTLNTSSGPLVSSDSMNEIQSQHLGKKMHTVGCAKCLILFEIIGSWRHYFRPLNDILPMGLLKRIASQQASWIGFPS